MRDLARSAALLAMALSMLTAGLPLQAKIPPVESRCCLLMKQDGCDQMPVKAPEQAQCCTGCVICLALPAEAASLSVHASTGEEAFDELSVHARPRADRPEVPPPRFALS